MDGTLLTRIVCRRLVPGKVGDREYTLDDCWALDLNTRLAWKCLQKGTMDEQMWKAEEEDSEMGSEWGEEEEEDGSDEEGSDQEEVREKHKQSLCG